MRCATVLMTAALLASLPAPASSYPSRTLYGYYNALKCWQASGVAKAAAAQSGKSADVQRFEEGSVRSWNFAKETARLLGRDDAQFNLDLDESKPQVKKMLRDQAYFKDALVMCRDLGLIRFDD